MANLYELFLKSDATQVEINPFAETSEDLGSNQIHTKLHILFGWHVEWKFILNLHVYAYIIHHTYSLLRGCQD